ncbi:MULTISPECIES: hypothetical protein [Nocardia]|uniref:GDT1 family protein n=2 Tax=Nocardia TaxID=1817 RepID=A0ABM8D6H1_9NOCA|nr:hypothetical protein [Nocardia sputorum]BDT93721.1 hypothetical protein IFM12275_36970 [Nocardia sputorum]BDU02942.1 hypothetical protein IFM12276_59700 [Nocardia sputorum]
MRACYLREATHPPVGRRAAWSMMGTVSSDVTVIVLFALAGFLLGGAYTTWKTARPLSIALAVCAVLAAGGALAWWLG